MFKMESEIQSSARLKKGAWQLWESPFVDYVNCEMERKKFPSAWYGKVKLNFIGWTLDGEKLSKQERGGIVG